MGYQDGMGLRPGRTKDKLSADRGNTDSTFSAAAGYRAAGAVSPVREAPKSDAMATGGGGGVLSQFSADAGPKVPKAPGLLQTVGGAVGTRVAGNALEKGYDRASAGASNNWRGVDALFNGGNDLRLADTAKDAGGYINLTTGAETFPVVDSGAGIESLGDFAGSATDLAGGGDLYFDDWGVGSDLASGSELADVGGGGIPYLGAGLKLAQGDVGGAALTAAGYAIGGPVGGFIGSVLGGGCFITEATMAGLGVQDDEAEPLQVLRFFRDKVLAGTPQGQAMIQEYEDIAPLVVEAIESRPDAMEIFKKLYTDFIAPAVEAIKAQNFPQALQIYAAKIAAVTPLAQEAMDAEDAMEGEMQQAGET